MVGAMTGPPYTELTHKLKKAQLLTSVGDVLVWDEQVNLPPASAVFRGDQMAAIAELAHAAISEPRIGELVDALDGESLTDDERTVVHWARRDHERATKLPGEFVRTKAEQGSRGFHAWAQAKQASDFASYAPVLATNLELCRREAAYLGKGDAPYDYMLDRHDPGTTAAVITPLFAELAAGLAPIVGAITSSGTRARPLRGFSLDGQRTLLREVTEQIGFDYQRGRMDVALHPFSIGNGADTRLTTRFDIDAPLDSLFSAIHEAGHGMYEQGLDGANHHTALGQAAGMAVHESQSRLWENQVGRSRGFWRRFEPRLRELFPGALAGISSDELYLAINAVAMSPIRTMSDEVTYNLHVILRFEIEQQLFSGALAVADLPGAWNAAAARLLGLTPANDREGVLQDVHWSDGSFGYFPSYTLGTMMAAQLWATMVERGVVSDDDFARGDFSRVLGWLREHVHARGKRETLLALVRRATGHELSPRYLLEYLTARYLPLYS
jgi:carboxypeptidase Taq